MATSAGKNISYGSRHMSTLWNPFSYRNNEPKYPDGLAQYSIGRKWTNITRVQGKDIVIVLYPGQLAWCAICGTATTPEEEESFRLYDVHTTHESLSYTYTSRRDTSLGEDVGDPSKAYDIWSKAFTVEKNKYSAWRPVSCAVKIKSLNRVLCQLGSNDGWWEAIRSSKMIDSMDFGLRSDPEPDDGDKPLGETFLPPVGAVVPTGRWRTEISSAQNWSLQPSYATGTTIELGRWQFQLNQIRNDNEFIDVTDVLFADPSNQGRTSPEAENIFPLVYPNMQSNPEQQQVNFGNIHTWEIGKDTQRYGDLQASGEETVTGQKSSGFMTTFSSAMDMILIKIHGTADSEYLISSVMNQEFLANDTDLKDYQTTSYAALSELEEYLAIRSRDYKMPNHNYYNQKMKF